MHDNSGIKASTGEHGHINIKLWLQGHLLVLVVKDSTNSIVRFCLTCFISFDQLSWVATNYNIIWVSVVDVYYIKG